MAQPGYWVNWEETFYYQGDTKTLNQFLEAYGKFKYVTLRVVTHTGTKNASSPWDKAERNLPVEWSLYVWNTGYPVLTYLPGEKEVELLPPGSPPPHVSISGLAKRSSSRISTFPQLWRQ